MRGKIKELLFIKIIAFLITLFLAIKLWARIPLQIADSQSALYLHLCVTFQKRILALHCMVKFDQPTCLF